MPDGKVTVPVKVGEASGALASSCVCTAEVTPSKYPISVELTFPMLVVLGRTTVPVKVGPASGALAAKSVVRLATFD